MKDFERLFLDTETFSGVDLKKVGAYAYAEHPTTEIMICTYAIDEGRVQTWDATESPTMPRELRKALRQVSRKKAKIVMANGLLFDRLVIREKWGIDLPVSQIEDTMIMAFRHALPGSLDMQCQVLGVDAEHAKDKAGKALIKRFCKPTPKTYKIRRYTRETHPEEWAKFLRYAALDIIAMREVYWRIPDWGNTPKEDEILLIDQLINDRGFYVDVDLANAAIKAVQAHKEELKEEAWERFGGKLTGNDFLPILRDIAPAFTIHNAQKSTLNDLLEDPDFPDEGKALIEMRLGASSTASTKYNPLVNGLSADGRRRGCLQYGGAKRTLRWAGKGFQPQNLARGEYSDDHEGKIKRREGESDVAFWVRSHMLTNGINSLLRGTAHWAYDISKLTASTVRGCIIPAKGKKFVVADYSNVEGRGLAWIAGEKTALMVFKAGRDIYCETAGKMFGLDPDYIKANRKDLRQIGKACELGLGYGGGVAAFLQFAKNLGLDLYTMADVMKGTFPDHIWAAAKRGYEYARINEAKRPPKPGKKDERPTYILPKNVWLTCDAIKRMWREAHPKTVAFWAELEDAVLCAIRNPGKAYWAGANVRPDGRKALKIVRTKAKHDPTFDEERDDPNAAGWWLKIELPSGRIMSYPGIGLSVTTEIDEDTGKKRTSTRIKYQGENQTTRQWGFQYTYGGKLTENIVQALCRDILAWSMPGVEAAGYEIVLSVHDELITEVPDTDDYTTEELCALMCDLPVWAKGFPLAAEGDIMYRYRK
ncbi:DNA polymerase I [Escherichia phage vB_EcoS_bov15_1]|uniref:DNA polymerase I n=1 Tax=Escherichia phage vb_EcoS_bov22_1 TaxID=2763527 RepID=A0AAE7MCP4_9CAUD|nr:DNA polymerase I [Escherichia phage vb_EcoS_bov22_1]QNR53560.1 DNA polymerase I [Escherichia phage vb_EcoS_bov11C2]QNR53634.1 DNA polymerase I [Escherichia phage vb_EcoS_bov16_1]QNR53770.1 DNA polymerase I [Escherichia phage vb_EcoS_bov25_1D]QOI69581.1 DNA polymerase I [Escherichia phage vB_EcoS_bov15_1]QNR53683.1 DNA polymerase I [Escherichia phage vb_EcoS_bov22_1]